MKCILSCRVLVIVVLLSLLSACSNSSASTPADGTTSDSGSPQQEPVEIQWLVWSDDVSQEGNLIEEIELFNTSQSDVIVELVAAPYGEFNAKLQAMIASNTAPDVISIQNESDAVAKGWLLSLDELMARDNLDVERFVPGAHTPAYDGKYYGFRHDMAYWVLFYNKDAFDQAGVPYPPEEGWSMDEFMEIACQFSNPAEQTWGVYNWHWLNPYIIQSMGLPYLETGSEGPQYMLDNPEVIEVYQMIGDFINERNCQPNADQSQSLVGDPFTAGQTVMAFNGNWAFGKVQEDAQFAWDVAPVPGGKNGVFGMKIGIAQNSDAPDAAWTFLKWLTYEPEATRYRAERGMGQPAINDDEAWEIYLNGPTTPAGLQSVIDIMSDAANTIPEPDAPGKTQADGVLSPAIDEVWNGTGTAQEVMPSAVEKANEILSEEWAKINEQ
ncbi:MAG: sugar ABC transporter substrate-binding protein [Chloroflexi bacterium AL-W]|nr:sugar ABC transporter substrate-binding protein [Chloroflexi bacterium AL-N1]NOK65925.1 sugar ABC transporter substrate-binding protein [Chloroflexi bacterium AL-N10]NOK72806.1 sugar ABC transporter substrate-binding protein [Chloroflexi bacterium AL-N5]NOK79703.1 sugar ABC transporter substrate-binding protein [Chloroflexi bacterium AL-W]NOK93028.1 sugar ABC transporter substrate-binding protein [Chloroflexi bacterium AL-N15]